MLSNLGSTAYLSSGVEVTQFFLVLQVASTPSMGYLVR